MHIIFLSGPVASGKSTLCRALERRFGMTLLQTRELITRNLDLNGAVDRKDLQWEGERLDRETGGAWIRDELTQVLNECVAEGALVIDAVRTREQVRIIRDTYDSAVSHIHLTAPERMLSVRYETKPKPRWDVHLPGAGNRGGSLAGVFRRLIAGPSGSAVSPRLSGWTARPGICRPSPAPPPGSPGTDCQWPPLSPSPR